MYEDARSAYFQNQLMYWGPKVLIALLILLATWLVARAAAWALQKAVDKSPTLQRHTTGKPGETLGSQLATVVKLVIWLVGIMAALQFLGIGQILQPVNTLTMNIFEFLPRLIGAGLIFFIGLIVARIVRKLVETALTAANVEGLLGKVGLGGSSAPSDQNDTATTMTGAAATGGVAPAPASSGSTATRASLARAAGILAFAFLIIPFAIAALDVLNIEAISGPATNMLNQILAALPRVLSAALWIGIAFIAGKFLKSIIEAILPPTGFDQAIRSTGIVPANTTPSRIVANVAMIAVILIAAIEAAKQLGGGTVAIFLAQVTELGGKVIFGSLIIVVGIMLARVIAGLVGSGTGEGGYAQTVVRYAIIALFTAIGLTFMGLADTIVQMAFGLILGAAAVATAIAFGLGGREAAARVLNQAADKAQARMNAPTPPPASSRTPRTPSAPAGGDSQPPLV